MFGLLLMFPLTYNPSPILDPRPPNPPVSVGAVDGFPKPVKPAVAGFANWFV